MENDLVTYIRSTFNYMVDIDAHSFQDTAKLQLLNKSSYGIYFYPIETYSPKFKETEEIYQKLMMHAFDAWSEAIHNKITFYKVEKEYQSDIKIFFLAASITKLGKQYQEMIVDGAVGGMPFYIKGKLCIAIGIRDYKNEKIDYDKVYHVMLHEIGHIFCLGHSPNKSDVMCGKGGDFPTDLTENDIFVLRLIYHIGNGKSYNDSKKYIEECVQSFENYKQKQKKPEKISLPVVKEVKVPSVKSDKKDLLEDLTSIGELRKYKMIIEQIKINDKEN